MSKRFLKRIMAAAAAIIFICSTAMAESFSFEGEREECAFSALNRGNACERGVTYEKSYSGSGAYRLCGEGTLGFRMVGALSDDTAEDSNGYYRLSAMIYSENGASVSAAITTPGGFAGTEQSFEITPEVWQEIGFVFHPVKNSLLNTVSFSSDNGGEIFIDEVSITRSGERFLLQKSVDFEPGSGWQIYNGTNGPIYESGARVGYTSSSTGYGGSGKTGGNNTFLRQDVKAGSVSGVNLHGQMKLEAGKKYKLSCRMAASGAAQPGEVKVIVGRTFLDTWFDSGVSRYTDYAEEDLIMSDSITNDENWRYYETEFTAMEGTTGKSAVVIGVFNKSAANVQYGIDDIEIFEEIPAE